MQNKLYELTAAKRAGKRAGIASFCTSNELALEACMRAGAEGGYPVLVEATANQINQYGGYTGMLPAGFRDYALGLARRAGLPEERLYLGGDHLGPLIWANEPEAAAMEKAEELVRLFVLAGYTKIHLDTSMRLGDDDPAQPLTDATVARRGARLFKACIEAFEELQKKSPDAVPPVFVIGSEVPIPGGTAESADSLAVTSPAALRRTVEAYRAAFAAAGCGPQFERVIGLVVQPGVEFSGDSFFRYDRARASALIRAADEYGGLVLEGHSTDYQPPSALREMVEDGIAVLKVGPALTFAAREGLFALDMMERELLPESGRANYADTLERVMLAEPGKWEGHYRGDEAELRLKRRYSFSDRSRYYAASPVLRSAEERLFANLDRAGIPLCLLSQFMPAQYRKAAEGALPLRARELVLDHIREVICDYEHAAAPQRDGPPEGGRLRKDDSHE